MLWQGLSQGRRKVGEGGRSLEVSGRGRKAIGRAEGGLHGFLLIRFISFTEFYRFSQFDFDTS